jgi:hypothetical protein
MTTVLIFLFGFVFLNLLFSNYSIEFLVSKISSHKITFKCKYGFFVLPFFFYFARKLQLKVDKEFGKDEIELDIQKISFWINPFFLLIGKLQIRNLQIKGLKGKYINLIPSKEKINWLPQKGRFLLKNASLQNGELFIEDKVLISQPKILLKNINIYRTSFDLAYPVQLLFFSKSASCNLGSGYVKTELIFPNHGFFKISGLTLGEFLNVGGINLDPLSITVLELHADYKHFPDKTHIRGIFGKKAKMKEANINDTKERFAFQFALSWKDYRLPIDMAIQKLILLIFEGTVIKGVVNTTLNFIRDSILSIIRKEEKGV